MTNINTNNIAYLAPEIPSISTTFIYQEILALEKEGVNLIPVSIHRAKDKAESDVLQQLENRTLFLYEYPLLKIILNHILYVPNIYRYVSTLWMLLGDIKKAGLFTHTAKGLLYRFFISTSLARYLKHNNVSHIHSNFAHIPTDIAMYAAGFEGITFSFTSHANDLFERGWLLKEKISRSKFCVTISNYNKNYLIEHGADSNKIHIIHCGVDLSKFFRQNSKDEHDTIRLGSLGRLVEKKGFDQLIKSCFYLKQSGVHFKLEIAGDGPLKYELSNLITELGLEENVILLGKTSHDSVPDWLRTLDIFLLACKRDHNGDMDGLPVVLMEAIISGIPVISTNISGIPELVVDGETGLLCNENDAECIANKVKELISDKSMKDRIIEKAIKKVKDDYSISINSKRLATLLMK